MNKADEWLASFSIFSIYQILPEIIELWGVNTKTMETAKNYPAKLSTK